MDLLAKVPVWFRWRSLPDGLVWAFGFGSVDGFRRGEFLVWRLRRVCGEEMWWFRAAWCWALIGGEEEDEVSVLMEVTVVWGWMVGWDFSAWPLCSFFVYLMCSCRGFLSGKSRMEIEWDWRSVCTLQGVLAVMQFEGGSWLFPKINRLYEREREREWFSYFFFKI